MLSRAVSGYTYFSWVKLGAFTVGIEVDHVNIYKTENVGVSVNFAYFADRFIVELPGILSGFYPTPMKNNMNPERFENSLIAV